MKKNNSRNIPKTLNSLKDIFSKCTFQCIMFILTLIIGIWILFTNNLAYGIKPYILCFLTAIIPPLSFLRYIIKKYKSYKNKETRSDINWNTAIISVGLPIFYILMVFIIFGMTLGVDVKNPRYYKQFLNEELIEIFPESIPKNAEKIKYLHSDPFLQKGEENLLYYVDKSLEQNVVDNKYREKALWIGKFDDEDKPKSIGNPINQLYDIDEIGNVEDFLVYVFKDSCYGDGYCNHGEYIYVAYNDVTKEIIYKQEHW